MGFFINGYWPREPKASHRDDKSLWFHRKKIGMAKRIQKGDRILLYEHKEHPDHDDWQGSGRIYASGTASGELIEVPEASIVGDRKWDIKMPIEIDFIVERDKGVEWKRVQELLNLKPRDNLIHPPREITKEQFQKIEDELRKTEDYDERETTLDELIEKGKWFIEGGKTIKTHLAYERNRAIIAEAKRDVMRKNAKLFCSICSFSFEDVYGELGKDIIDFHHITPVSHLTSKKAIKTSDLIPICPNCHRVIHSKRPFLSIDEVENNMRRKYR